MTTNNRIKEIQEEYFDFCLTLLQKIPEELLHTQRLVIRAYYLRDELSKAIGQNRKDFYNPNLCEMNAKIKELKEEIETRS